MTLLDEAIEGMLDYVARLEDDQCDVDVDYVPSFGCRICGASTYDELPVQLELKPGVWLLEILCPACTLHLSEFIR